MAVKASFIIMEKTGILYMILDGEVSHKETEINHLKQSKSFLSNVNLFYFSPK